MNQEPLDEARHEVALYSDSYEMKGTLVMRPPRRFLDILNDRFRLILSLTEASIRPLVAEPGTRPLAVPSLMVNKEGIIMARLIEETKIPSGEFITVHKVARPVTAYVGPFVIHGQMHALQEASLLQALDAVAEDFIALTKPSALCVTSPWLSLKGGIIAAVRKSSLAALQERAS
ncbi:MAG TPA: hypothetical protein DCP08_00535 [Chloroflexi bacterium]|nr:hypothetical protein [Chloroflexota bacterium]